MEEIDKIYSNSFGISFRWKNALVKNVEKTQIIFRDTGVFLSTSRKLGTYTFFLQTYKAHTRLFNGTIYI